MRNDLILHPDGRHRCAWAGTDALYLAYHDAEWGVPERDDRALFEILVLEGFQAGLSWITILRKREAFRRAFAGFDPGAVARFGPSEVEGLMRDPGTVRHRAKIEGALASARAWLKVQEREGFGSFVWGFVDGRSVQPDRRSRAEVPAETDTSRRLSGALRREGFAFCGAKTVYAFMQAAGLVNDHLVGCHRHAACAASSGTLR